MTTIPSNWNPFYSNHIFSKKDLRRFTIKWWQYPLLWFRKTYVQFNDGYVFYFKRDGQGRYYLMKTEELPDQTDLEFTERRD